MKYELMIETKNMIKINVFSHTREGLQSAFEKIEATKDLISAIIFSVRDGEIFKLEK